MNAWTNDFGENWQAIQFQLCKMPVGQARRMVNCLRWQLRILKYYYG